MKLTFKNVFLSLGVAVFSLAIFTFVGINSAYANTCTAVTGNWNTVGTWSGCGGVVPASADAVVIPTAVTVTVDTAAVANTVSISDPITAGNGLTFSGSNSLTLGSMLTILGSSGTGHSTVAVGAGTLNVANLAIIGGASSGNSVVSVSTGTITSSGSISMSGAAAQAQLTSTGASNINIGGDFPGGGTLNGTGGTITFNGSGAQTIGAFITFNNVVINKSAGTATANGATTVGGNLTVTTGTLDMATAVYTVTGATSIASGGTLTLSSATGLKTFTGNVTITGTWNESAVVAVTSVGNFTNNAVTFTASTGVHTFSGTSKTISGTTSTIIPSVSISGTVTNSNTLTVATLLTVAGSLTNNGTTTATTALSGAGSFVNGTTGTLNIGGTSAMTTFTVSSTGNTVNYTASGVQTVLAPATAYYNLTVNGSGVKTIGAITVISNNFTIGDTASALLTGASTANKVYLGNALAKRGSWGGNATAATNVNTTYFGAGGTGKVTAATGKLVGYTGDKGGIDSTGTNSKDINPSVTAVVAKNATVTAPVPQLIVTAVPLVIIPAQVIAKTYNFGQFVLQSGSQGEAVMELQRYLNDKLGLSLKLDGKLGPNTIAIIKKWQKDNGLKADGKIGAKTKALMMK